METHERTHTWLSFSLDLSRADYSLWRALGEAQSNCEYIASMPLRPATAQTLYRIYLAKGSLATTALAGNTLAEEEVLQHLSAAEGEPPGKPGLYREIDNIAGACDWILDRAMDDSGLAVSVEDICRLNRMALDGIPLSDGVVPGEVRDHGVLITNDRGMPPEECGVLLARLCEWLNGEEFLAPEGLATVYGLLQALSAHAYLSWIHPFGEGNNRTARLVEYLLLVKTGVIAPSAHLMSIHYNSTRHEYKKHLSAAIKSGGDILPFAEYAVGGFVEGLHSQIQFIHEQRWVMDWYETEDGCTVS